MRRLSILVAILVWLTAQQAFAQTDPSSEGLEERIVSVPLARGAEIRALASKRTGTSPGNVALLFVGSPGILHLKEVDGKPVFGMKGNFLARARRHLNDDSVMTVLVDCPTDEWNGCDATYRRSARHAEDVGALISALTTELGPVKVSIVGTSFGTVSTANLARRLPGLAGAVHTASFAGSSKPSFEAGMTGFGWDEAKVPQLFVHHIDDICAATPYRELKSAIGDLPLITVIGAKDTSGPPCEAYSEHGFRGRERDVMRAIAAWISTGRIMPRVGAP
jgi:pimeloyl-ACP methyl ester carboxylesterase